MGLVPATGPGDQVPSCELPILVKKCSHRDQTGLNSWDQFRVLVPSCELFMGQVTATK